MKKTLSLILLAFAILCTGSTSEARVYLDITSPDFRKIPMAVPYFVDKFRTDQYIEQGKQMADILSRGLSFHGFISVISPDTYGGRQDADWQKLAANFTVLGQYSNSSDGVVLELRLLDITEGRMLFGRRYKGPWKKHKEMILKFCDEVILQLTGEPGISLSKIAFVSDASGHKEVYVSDLLGDDIRRVTRHKNLTVSPRFTADGKKVSYTSFHNGNQDLYITDLSQTKTTRALSRRRGMNLAPAWSPEGKTMALTLSKDGNPDLYLMNDKGEILRRLTKNAGLNVSPSWSPDGSKITFVSDRSGTPQIYVMDVNTRRVKRITFEGNDNSEPSWSPKGDWIAYAGLYEGNYHIFLVRPEGGTSVRITKYWGDHESPCWSPDGRQIVFTQIRNSEKKICAIFKNGSGMRKLFDAVGNQNSPQWSIRMN